MWSMFTRMKPIVRPVDPADAAAIANVYNHYVLRSIVTFEEEPVPVPDMRRRIEASINAGSSWFVAADQTAGVVGYAYALPWKTRSAYRHSVEITVYLAPEWAGRGVGTQLYEALFATLRERGVHAVIGGIALPNEASKALHEKFGMTQVAMFKEVGHKFGRWIDVGYWQKTL